VHVAMAPSLSKHSPANVKRKPSGYAFINTIIYMTNSRFVSAATVRVNYPLDETRAGQAKPGKEGKGVGRRRATYLEDGCMIAAVSACTEWRVRLGCC
jgi:hypothetical protein